MSWSERESLYSMLPDVYRIRDQREREPLRTLSAILENEYEILEADIAALYANWFIETCDPWVIPYIGDLVGNKPLHGAVRPARADVAKTIYYRRRKSTVLMLEELTRDVTGWDANVIEFFRLLLWNQHTNHQRISVAPTPALTDAVVVPAPMTPGSAANSRVGRLGPYAVDAVGNVNLRDLDALDQVCGPFDSAGHTVDVRPATDARDRYILNKVGFYLRQLQGYALEEITPAPSGNAVTSEGTQYGYHLSTLGAPFPLYKQPETRTEYTRPVEEIHVNGPIRPLAIHGDFEKCRAEMTLSAACESVYVGGERSLQFVKDGEEIAPEMIVVMDLREWKPPPEAVLYHVSDVDVELPVVAGIDVGLGRVVFAPGHEPTVSDEGEHDLSVSCSYGFSADIGGGPYPREDSVVAKDDDSLTWSMTVARDGDADFDTLGDALAAWEAAADNSKSLITIRDSKTYVLDSPVLNFPADADPAVHLTIQADDGTRPTIRITDGDAVGAMVVSAAAVADDGGSLTLSGLLIEGGVSVAGDLRNLNILHSTLVPGGSLDENANPTQPAMPSVLVDADNSRLEMKIEFSIVGSIEASDTIVSLSARDSIIDVPTPRTRTSAGELIEPAPEGLGERRAAIAATADGQAPGPNTTLECVTVLGKVHVKQLTLASEVIFTEVVTAQRRQSGCVRFSYLPAGSVTPRRYQCHSADDGVFPQFTSVHYLDPAYAQLSTLCSEEIRTGAEDGAEMGVFSTLKQPQREANLRTRLDEYLPIGLEPAVVFVP